MREKSPHRRVCPRCEFHRHWHGASASRMQRSAPFILEERTRGVGPSKQIYVQVKSREEGFVVSAASSSGFVGGSVGQVADGAKSSIKSRKRGGRPLRQLPPSRASSSNPRNTLRRVHRCGSV